MKEAIEGDKSSQEESTTIIIGPEFIDPLYNHLHHAGYFYLLEEERARLGKSHGIDLEELAKQGIFLPVVEIDEGKYRREVRLGEVVDIKTTVDTTLAKIVFKQRMEKNGEIAMSATITCAVVTEMGRPRRVPQWIKEKFVKKVE